MSDDYAEKLVKTAMAVLNEKQALNPVALDLRGITSLCDFFLICHGGNARHTKTLAEEVEHVILENLKVRPLHVEGLRVADWVLLDYGDVVIHVFMEDRRDYYGLERIWSDAPRLQLD